MRRARRDLRLAAGAPRARSSRRFPGAATTESFDELLADDDDRRDRDRDSRHVALPLARAALEAGKHVFIEKPLAASSAECLELIRVARTADLVLMPGHTFLYSPPVVAIRKLIEAGALGDLYFISTSRVNLGLHQADVSVTGISAPTTSRSSTTGSAKRRRT